MKPSVAPRLVFPAMLLFVWLMSIPASTAAGDTAQVALHTASERPKDPFVPVPESQRSTSPAWSWSRNGVTIVQVNVDGLGANIVGDAANEPSIAVDPGNPEKIVIGWRQFDSITSDFRQAGVGYSSDGGQSWTFPGVIDPGVFRSDPVLDFDSAGKIYYNSLTVDSEFHCDVYTSTDSGVSWGAGVPAYGGDKQWMTVDRTAGVGAGHIYQHWSPFSAPQSFNRSVDGGQSFEPPVEISTPPTWGVNTVSPDGAVWVVGGSYAGYVDVARSSNAQVAGSTISFDLGQEVLIGGEQLGFANPSPNPGGLLGQVWIASDHSGGPNHGNIYILCSVDPPGDDPMDVMFVRSTDNGASWSAPLRINDESGGLSFAWQWFGTMSVAPDGRIDVVWNDTRSDPGGFDSKLYYSYSSDGGLTWSPEQVLSPSFDPHLGWPQQNKLGDYYDMVSDATGAHLAWAATFNGEQDVYYLHIDPPVLFADGFESGDTGAWSLVVP